MANMIGVEALPLFDAARAQQMKDRHRRRHAGKHAADIERLIPLALELARKAGPDGVTVGDIRCVAEARGLLERGAGRSLSWLVALPRAAGLVPTDRRRISPLTRSRNDHVVFVAPEFSEPLLRQPPIIDETSQRENFE